MRDNDTVLDRGEQPWQTRSKEIRQKAERSMALRTIPAGNAHTGRRQALIASMTRKGTAALRMKRATRQARMAPLLIRDIGISGCCLALHHLDPELPVYSVEPRTHDDTRRSLLAGERVAIEPGGASICDALLSPIPGELTFPINRQYMTAGLAVTDDEVLHAMAVAFQWLKLVVEPGGAVALAAALFGHIEIKGRTVAVVASGGNVDPAMYQRALTSGMATA